MNGSHAPTISPACPVWRSRRPSQALRLAGSAALIAFANLLGACAPQVAGNTPAEPPAAAPAPAPSPALPPGVEGMACTMDVIQCSNGDWVGRKPPGCQFTCPPGSTPAPSR